MNSCRIYEEDTRAHYKVVNERKTKGQHSRPKPYSAPADKGKQRMVEERRPKKKDVPAEITYFNCGEKGHKSNVCPEEVKKCFRCGKKGHTLAECKHGDIACFNCKEEGHIGFRCKQPKRAPTTGRFFALAVFPDEIPDMPP
ncbi:zinc finger protein GIS2-like [Medicago truncatula]|uniref:zinc finger protein GIS2-like n=1 Tax=Medicago truncatula TaxID=3880 RepID=UPI0019673DAC|nr:zinc finger protein GIS2-like [Medicago truncatula]